MGKRGPKPRRGLARELNGRVSRRNEDMHARGDKAYAGWAVYFATTAGLTKVGFSGDVQTRIRKIGWEHDTTLRLMGVVGTANEYDSRSLEKFIHARLIRLGFHFDGEWFDMGDRDIKAEIDRLRAEGRTILSGITAETPEVALHPTHRHTDAAGRKFAGIAARSR